jgi:hypothetical protein
MAGVALITAVDAVLCLNGSFGHRRGTSTLSGLQKFASWMSLQHTKSAAPFVGKLYIFSPDAGLRPGSPLVNRDIQRNRRALARFPLGRVSAVSSEFQVAWL